MRLEIRLLGNFEVKLDGRPITGFESNKVRALLAYLAVETNRPQPRERLAGLLWPDWPQGAAMSNLRYALADLRKNIADRQAEPPFLIISRESIQLNLESDCATDIQQFEQQIADVREKEVAVNRLLSAVGLYRGEFLEGFSLADSPDYEDWARANREHYRRQAIQAMDSLAAIHAQNGEYDQAIEVLRCILQIEPWHEPAHQQVMRCLAAQGKRVEALSQFEMLRKALKEALDVEPSEDTFQIYEQVRSGKWAAPAALPAFLTQKEIPREPHPLFVAREAELTRLRQALDQALAGRGSAIFVTGEPGRGKTSLVQEFTIQAMQAHPDLSIAQGNCQAYFGQGDPYLPFREILEMLTGDVEDRWAGGRIRQSHALQLWQLSRRSLQLLAEEGPALVDTLLPANALLRRASQVAQGEPAWLKRLQELAQYRQKTLSGTQSDPQALFSQYSKVLLALSRLSPLLLFLDDLQWSDPGSLSLLFTLGRQVAQGRILLIGAYRPEEILPGADGKHHPLAAIIHELQLLYGENLIKLDDADERGFIDAYLDSQPNQLNPAFRQRLFEHTRGHPLYTAELLRGMQGRSELFQNQAGEWEESPWLDWEALPARVEAAIGERINRLSDQLRDLLQAASIQGEWFIAEALAEMQDINILTLVKLLAGVLERQHQLVRSDSLMRVNNQRLSRYRFRHILIQRYLYNSIDPILRAHLHDQAGVVLERLYGSHSDEIAAQLARHFEEAGLIVKAIEYLQRAGERAAAISANTEAITYLSRALKLTPETDLESRFRLLLGRVQVYHRTTQRQEQDADIQTLEYLSQSLGPAHKAQAALSRISLVEQTTGLDLEKIASAAIAWAQQAGNLGLEAEGHWKLGLAQESNLISIQILQQAVSLARQAGIKRLEADILRDLAIIFGFLNTQDDRNQCLSLSEDALKIYRNLGDRYGEGRVLNVIGMTYQYWGDFSQSLPYHEQSLKICQEVGNRFDEAWAFFMCTRLYLCSGYHLEEAINRLHKAIQICKDIGYLELEVRCNSLLAEAYQLQGETMKALNCSKKYNQQLKIMDPLVQFEQKSLYGALLMEAGQYEGAERVFREILNMYQEISWLDRLIWAQISLGRLALLQGDPRQAMKWIEQFLSFDTRGLNFYLYNVNIVSYHLVAYQVLKANLDPRAAKILEEGYSLLMERASQIDNEEMRRSYLENVPSNRELAALWQAQHQ